MPETRSGVFRTVAAAAVLGALTVACAGPVPEADDDLDGERLEVLAVWSQGEQERFEQVLRAFESETGASVRYTSAGHDFPAVLDARLEAGDPPDVAFLPQPGLLRRYAISGRLLPLERAVDAVVKRNYAPVWRRLATVDGQLYGVWFKAANKSLAWYNVALLERAGLVPPSDLDGLVAVADTLRSTGVRAFALAGGDPWTLTDWFENLYARVAGPELYDRLAGHRIPWTHPSVRETLEVYVRLLSPDVVAGALDRTFEDSVGSSFSEWPSAAMVVGGDFVGGVITSTTSADLGIDADVFPFPSAGGSSPVVVGGGDAAVLLRDSAAGAALLRFLATPDAARVWAAAGGFVSPNLNLDLAEYPDEITRSIARSVLDAGDAFRFDLSDLQPPAFGGTSSQGMRPLLRELLVTGDVDGTAARLEAEAAAAFEAA